MIRKIIILSTVLIILNGKLCGQRGNDTPTNLDQLSVKTQISDTAAVKDTIKINTFASIFRGRPGRAALYSAILPGGGQVYNKKWWKVPLAIGIDGFTIYNIIKTKSVYNEFNNRFLNLAKGGSDPDYTSASDIKPIRDAARTNSEMSILFFAIGHVIVIFDAYIDRHLIEFDTSPDLSFKLFPSKGLGDIPAVGLAYNF